MAEFSLVALKDEIVNDPEGLGYKNSATPTDWKGDQVIADLINAKNYVIDAEAVGVAEMRSACEYDWYNALAIDEQEFMRWQTAEGAWRVSAPMKLILTGRALTTNGVTGTGNNSNSWWSAGTRNDAAPAMLALIEQSASRAEVLWGAGETVSLGEVGRAFNEI